jgi:hypothetical protein
MVLTCMLPIIEQIPQKLAKYPSAQVKNGEASVTYFPDAEDGFLGRCVFASRPGALRVL